MVKRIRKRTEKNENTPEVDPDSIGHEDGSSSLRNELAQLGEDGFTRQLASGMAWMAENGVMLSVVAVVVFGGFIGIEAMEGKADADLAEASAAFQAAADAYSDSKAEAKEGETPKPAAEVKSTVEKAARDFASARKVYGEGRIATLAGLGEAGAAADLGEYDRAVKLYDGFLADTSIDAFARAIALQAKASAQESAGDIAGARGTWSTLAKLDTKAYGLVAGMQEGRLLEAEGKAAEAVKTYNRLKAEFAADLSGFGNREVKTALDRNLARLAEAG